MANRSLYHIPPWRVEEQIQPWKRQFQSGFKTAAFPVDKKKGCVG
jgi:hypothetical protein